MYISARERMILDILLSINEEMTVKQLSEELNVSERTVHRDLKGVESILKDSGLHLAKKSGVGIQIIGSKESVKQLQLMLYSQSPVEFTPEERQTLILCALLEANEPIKLTSLATDLNVTMVTVSNDLKKLEDRLFGYELFINKKRGYGVEITGSETAKRRAMRSIISENIDEVEFLSLVRENIQKQTRYQTDTLSEKLLGLVAKDKLVIVERVVEEVNSERDISIADSAYIGLVVHLALAIERIQHGENINMDETYLQRLQASSEYQMAERIAVKLASVFQLEIPEAEIGYITMHLQGAKLRQDKEYVVDDKSLEASEKANALIKFVEKEMGTDLSGNFPLFSGLVTHLEPALYRIERNMGIANPLLTNIKRDYKNLFDTIKRGVQTVFTGIVVPDEEIGYLVLHFGSALLNENKPLNLTALIICSTGIGTSKILASRLAREFPEIKELKNVSLLELDRLPFNEYDLVISTVKIPNFTKDYILVSPILTQEEMKKIRAVIHEKQAGQKIKKSSALQKSSHFVDFQTTIETMEGIESAAGTIVDILKNFKVRETNKGNINDVLSEVCFNLEENQVISEASSVARALLDREKLGGLGIPETQLALFHTRHHHILKPIFLVIGLKSPLKVVSMTQEIMQIDSLLMLLAPESVSSIELEILSFISAIIIESKESLALFESKNESSIQSYLTKKLNELFWRKFTEMRE